MELKKSTMKSKQAGKQYSESSLGGRKQVPAAGDGRGECSRKLEPQAVHLEGEENGSVNGNS